MGTFTGSTGYRITVRVGGFPSSNNPNKLRGCRCLFKRLSDELIFSSLRLFTSSYFPFYTGLRVYFYLASTDVELPCPPATTYPTYYWF